jgi:hypothetical protein
MAIPQTGQWRMRGRDVIANTIAEVRRAAFDPDQCGFQPLRRAAVPRRPPTIAQSDLHQCAGGFSAQAYLMWELISTAPFARDLELAVIDKDGPHPLVFPCRRILGGWMNAATQERMDVRPTHWRDWGATASGGVSAREA